MTHQTIADLLPHAEDYHQALTSAEREYLHARGITDKVIDRCKLGLCKYNKQLWISIPICDASGATAQMVLRKHPASTRAAQKRYLLPKGSSADLFGIDILQHDPDSIIVCEGLLDACAAQSVGLDAISGSAGVITFKDEWFDHIPTGDKKRKFYVCFDADKPGKHGAKKLLLKASELRPDLELFTIELPDMAAGKDLTDFLLGCTDPDKAKALLALAISYTPPTPQNRLLDSLADEISLVLIPPCQGCVNGKGFMTVTLRHEKKLVSFIVTSERECFECKAEEWEERGCQIDREPVTDATPRWEQKQLLAFARKEDGETMSLADAILYVREHLKRYLDFADPRCFSVIATWIILTYCYRLFPAIPYLHLTGLKGAGKTKVMQIVSLLCFNGELVTNSSSAASIVRLVHGNGATLGVDEAETMGSSKDENSGTLQEVLRSGYKQGIYVTKCEKDAEGRQTVIRLDPYSPKALSGIKGLEDALSSRCIEILMLRTTNADIANSEIVPLSSEWKDIRALVYPAVLLMIPTIKERIGTYMVKQFIGRNAELWKPLLLLADVAGHRELQEEILSYALEQVEQKKDDETDAEIGRILRCIDDLMGPQEKAFISADDIFTALVEDDDFSWLGEQKNKSKRGKWINSRLKRLALWKGRAVLQSIHGKKMRGYNIERSKLVKAAARLGVSLSSDAVEPDANLSSIIPQPLP